MKSLLLFLLCTFLTAVSPFARASDKAPFFAAPGSHVLSPEITLVITRDAETQAPKYMLNYQSGGGNGQAITTAKPEDPFLVYWDNATQTLWWATSVRVGYCDVSKRPTTTNTSSHERATPFRDSDKFPSRPAAFLAEMERTLPAQP